MPRQRRHIMRARLSFGLSTPTTPNAARPLALLNPFAARPRAQRGAEPELGSRDAAKMFRGRALRVETNSPPAAMNPSTTCTIASQVGLRMNRSSSPMTAIDRHFCSPRNAIGHYAVQNRIQNCPELWDTLTVAASRN